MSNMRSQMVPEGRRNMKKFFYNEYLKGKKLYDNNTLSVQPNISARSLDSRIRSRTTGVSEGDLHSPLQILEVTYDATNLEEHHTEKFELMETDAPTPVFRRGQPFTFFLHVNRMYNQENDQIIMVFIYGDPNSSYSNGTKYKVPTTTNIEQMNITQWGVLIREVKESMISIQIHAPVQSQVGVWFYRIDTILRTGQTRHGEKERFFYLLFNPWNSYDEVYLESEQERQKYILSDHGIIQVGKNELQIQSVPWVYGQFDFVVLPAVMRLFEDCKLPASQRGNVILIAREISDMVSETGENDGLIEGFWDPVDPNDRSVTDPKLWTGSVKIYEQYLASNGSPVRYAQCWVFGGCVVTACRALGIPCRPITCFASAHDTDKSLTLDFYYNFYGQPMPNPNGRRDDRGGRVSDSTPWNYHVWNEVWFTRKDLQGYDGWQAIDGTPQEMSNGRFALGPAPVRAVHDGDVGVNYDVSFVFSEVNADICHLYQDPYSRDGFSLRHVDTAAIGKFVGTFDFDSPNQRKLLTNIYKYPEGSQEERKTFYKAIRNNPVSQKFYRIRQSGGTLEDVDFKLSENTSLHFGDAFYISVNVKNKSNNMRTVKFLLEANAADATGMTLYETIKRVTKDIVFQPFAESVVRVEVTQKDYENSQRYSPFYEVIATCEVRETRQVYKSKDVFNIFLPDLIISGPKVAQVNVPFSLSLSFDNPLDKALTNCILITEGPRVQRPEIISLSDVPPKGKMVKEVSIEPKGVGYTEFVAIFHSEQLGRIQGKISFEVLASS